MKKLNKKRRWIATQPTVARNDDETATTRCPTKTFGHDRRWGFTLVELVITIAIVVVLSVISVPIYRGYTDKAKMAEAYALLGTILSAQKAYYSEYGIFLYGRMSSAGSALWTSCEETLGVDARGNKYFTLFRAGEGNGQTDNLKYNFFTYLSVPDELAKDSMSILTLYYNITTGHRYYWTK